MRHYGESLKYGDKFIYQSVPKILQFWLDFGDNVSEQGRIMFKYAKCSSVCNIYAFLG
jgi:hypothetical protein